MTPITSALPGEFHRNSLLTFGFLALAAFAAWEAAE
jgi:hypothetical protein